MNAPLYIFWPLYFLGHISNDRFRACFKDQLLFDYSRDSVGGRLLLASFYGYLIFLWEARVLQQDSKRFLQFDLFPIQDVMSHNQHWYTL